MFLDKLMNMAMPAELPAVMRRSLDSPAIVANFLTTMLKSGLLLLVIATLRLACGATEPTSLTAAEDRDVAALPVVPPGLNKRDALEVKLSKTVSALNTYTVSAPNLNAGEWIVLTPQAPDLAGQKILLAATLPSSAAITDLSPLKRPMLRARIPVTNKILASELTFKATVRAKLFARRLIRNDGTRLTTLPTTLAERERRLFLRRTANFDYSNAAVRAWLATNRLQRQADEGEVACARRVFLVIAKGFHYEYLGEQDRSAMHVCTAGKSDCGGLSILFVTALRSQGIPARILAGRWARSAKPGDQIGALDYYQEHVKAEFYAQGVGWVPADLSSAILHDPSPAKLDFFGNDCGDFLTFHLDDNLSFDSLHFGVKTMQFLQRPAYLAKGSGNFKNAVIRETWTVTPLP